MKICQLSERLDKQCDVYSRNNCYECRLDRDHHFFKQEKEQNNLKFKIVMAYREQCGTTYKSES